MSILFHIAEGQQQLVCQHRCGVKSLQRSKGSISHVSGCIGMIQLDLKFNICLLVFHLCHWEKSIGDSFTRTYGFFNEISKYISSPDSIKHAVVC